MSSAKFVHIAKVIEKRINQGEYRSNTKLPTHRVLAAELKTTPATIAKAYQLLANKRRVESHVGRGTYVCDNSALGQVIQAPEDGHDFNFSILQPCLHKNAEAIQKSYSTIAERLTPELIGYVEQSGHQAHRKAGCNWAKYYGLEGGNIDNTLLTNGAQHALSLLIQTFTQPGDTIAVEALTYPGIFAIANLSGRNVVGVTMDDNGVSPDALEATIVEHQPKLVVLIPSHQNPTGITMPLWRREELAQVIKKHSIWLIEDDIYGFLNEEPIPAITNFIPDRAFHISALSKAISPAMRCGYIKAPIEQIPRIQASIRANIWLPSPLNFQAATELIESGKAFTLAKEQRITAQERQLIAREVLTDFSSDTSSYHIWLPLPDQWKAEHFVQQAKTQNILTSSGSYFDVSGLESQHIRLSLMSVSTEDILKQGLNRLKIILDSQVSTLFPT
ncbi:aminotransferase-like domain-containing protein [Vibrio sagamiensis]|uniref:HTH gntR-type domain-containing protein n=1 Tax=Vibrio sagamiensis NBRC 104589 TaxID=1219064 RepID=A0A511QDE8_9VIBR|nr:PLP-dependent aminotransferase family protein [Vibrio sagamiensis]PNQ66924.1 PLP-dependent aminotransferase family protein [Vibrio agarivorans]GEM75216.1 hypothetical protein VSA01S_13280 [Vibrio sagamiensis NBRC 104589]